MEENELVKKNEEQGKTEKTRDFVKLLRILSILVAIILTALIILYKYSRPEFSAVITGLLIACAVLIPVLTFLVPFLIRKYEEAKEKTPISKLPPAITLEQADEYIEKELVNPRYADHHTGWKNHYFDISGKNIKCDILVVFLEKTLYNKQDDFVFVINLNYPEKRCLLRNPTPYEIKSRVNGLAVDPEDAPNTETIERRNPLLGTEEKITKVTQKEEAKKEKKKEDDL